MKTVRYIPAPKKKPQLSKTQEARWVALPLTVWKMGHSNH